MGISNREIQILISAEAAQAVATVGSVNAAIGQLNATALQGSLKMFAYSQAFQAVGQSTLKAGQFILNTMKSWGQAAMSFDHEMALAQTQAQLSGNVFQRVSQQALDISSKFGVAATDIAKGLYDIFSTTNSTAKEATVAISDLAKASIAGATDMSTVTRGVVDIQNAFGKAAGNTNQVLNLQFQMLRNSGGTYDELVSGFGNVISAGSQMDQTLQTLSGSIAFLTLRGRTQAQASISVSRALDQISKSATDIKKVLGVSVFDATGNFRQLNAIITDMSAKMANMTSQQRAKAFYDMFGAGSIQANRFFRIAVPQADKLNQSIDQMSKKEIAGQLQKAFEYMKKNDPSFIFNRMITSLKNLGIEIMNTLAPAFKVIIGHVKTLLDWFHNLSDEAKHNIAVWGLLSGVFLVVTGKVLMLAGGIMRMISIFKLAFGATKSLFTLFGSFSLAIAGVVLAIAALGVAAYLIIKHWDTFRKWWDDNWNIIKTVVVVAVSTIVSLITVRLIGAISQIPAALGAISAVSKGVFPKLINSLQNVALNFKGVTTGAWSFREAIAMSIKPATAYAIALGLVIAAGYEIYDVFFKQVREGATSLVDRVMGKDPDLTLKNLREMLNIHQEMNSGLFFGIGDILINQRKVKIAIDEVIAAQKQQHYSNAVLIQDYLQLDNAGIAKYAGPMALAIEQVTRVHLDEKLAVAGLISSYTTFGGKLSAAKQQIILMKLQQIHNLRVQGDQNGALKAYNELLKIERGWIRHVTGVLKNMLDPQTLVAEAAEDQAFHQLAVNSALKDFQRLSKPAIGALKNLATYAEAFAEKTADAAFRQLALNSAISDMPGTGGGSGGSGGTGGGSGGSGGTGGGSGGGGPGRRSGITVNVRTDATADEIVRAVDWARKTRGW